MKKKYKKPSIFIEDFSINQYIAGSCASNGDNFVTHTYHKSTCYIDFDGTGSTKIFDNSSCNIGADNIYDKDGVCYHGPIDVNMFFGS